MVDMLIIVTDSGAGQETMDLTVVYEDDELIKDASGTEASKAAFILLSASLSLCKTKRTSPLNGPCASI